MILCVQVQRVLSEDGRVTAVETSRGTVQCQYFVNSAGTTHATPQLGARTVSPVKGFLRGLSCHICGKNRAVLRSFVIEFSYCNSVRF
jgi:glycine/D-amino acid oxidase-like deaminating enzyme